MCVCVCVCVSVCVAGRGFRKSLGCGDLGMSTIKGGTVHRG